MHKRTNKAILFFMLANVCVCDKLKVSTSSLIFCSNYIFQYFHRFIIITMKKIFFTLLLFSHTLILISQTLQSPEQFLGYKIGAHFTPDYKIVNYFNAVAKAKPDMVRVEKYGETYEGRELILAYITSHANMQS